MIAPMRKTNVSRAAKPSARVLESSQFWISHQTKSNTRAVTAREFLVPSCALLDRSLHAPAQHHGGDGGDGQPGAPCDQQCVDVVVDVGTTHWASEPSSSTGSGLGWTDQHVPTSVVGTRATAGASMPA